MSDPGIRLKTRGVSRTFSIHGFALFRWSILITSAIYANAEEAEWGAWQLQKFKRLHVEETVSSCTLA